MPTHRKPEKFRAEAIAFLLSVRRQGTALLAFGVAVAMLSAGCKRQPRVVKALISPHELSLDLRRAALAAGGGDIWIKGTAEGEFPPRQPDEPVEVIAAPHAFERVPAALEREAAAHGLKFDEKDEKNGNIRRIQFLREKELLSTWEFRELPRLRRAAIVIDDMGANKKAAEELLALPYALTFSVLPNLRYSRGTAEQAHRHGREVMLHLPMEPIPRPGFMPGPGEVREGQSRAQVDRLVEEDLAAVPFIQGVNNHEGSQATEDPQLMADVMRVLRQHRLFFIDSRTTGASVALQAARRAGVPAFYRSVFLDDTVSLGYILGQLREFRDVVDEQGVALAIGHPHPETIRALREFLPRLAEDDIELLPASQLVTLPEAARLSPGRAARLEAKRQGPRTGD